MRTNMLDEKVNMLADFLQAIRRGMNQTVLEIRCQKVTPSWVRWDGIWVAELLIN